MSKMLKIKESQKHERKGDTKYPEVAQQQLARKKERERERDGVRVKKGGGEIE